VAGKQAGYGLPTAKRFSSMCVFDKRGIHLAAVVTILRG